MVLMEGGGGEIYNSYKKGGKLFMTCDEPNQVK